MHNGISERLDRIVFRRPSLDEWACAYGNQIPNHTKFISHHFRLFRIANTSIHHQHEQNTVAVDSFAELAV